MISLELPEDVSHAPTFALACARLGDLIGLPGPTMPEVTNRAIKDPEFAKALLASSKVPALRAHLLAHPENARFHPDQPEPGPLESGHLEPGRTPSIAKLAGKAAAATLKWGMEGLKHAKPWEIEKRLAACDACEFAADAPDTLVYNGAKVIVGKDAQICTACACLLNTKAAMASESCPKQDPANATLSRWGETWKEPPKERQWPW
ncbi:MAG TPA: hypothetical protein VMY41_06120 [Thermohalobaculum sp.]|nr:hypothetical protein [Thermohalobaculum sp.]